LKKRVKYFLLLLVLGACKTQYPGPEASLPHLEISEGGGFTGAITTHYLLKNGQVFRAIPLSSSNQALQPIKKRDAKKYMRSVKLATTGKEVIYEPDNIYRILRYVDKDTSYSVLWYGGRAELDSIYQGIIRNIEKANAQDK
jgi:hypothetical protein